MKEIGCKFARTVHISLFFWAIEALLPCKIIKIWPRPVKFSLRLFKPDRLLGPISGAHFNPLVTLMDWLRGALGARDAAAYIAAQLAGAIAGVMLANLMFDLAPIAFSEKPRASPGLWLSEIVATAGLVLTILLGLRHRAAAVPALVASYITAAYWFTASTSFANPSVTLARTLTPTFAGIAPADAPAFVLAQCLGAVAGLLCARLLLGSLRPA